MSEQVTKEKNSIETRRERNDSYDHQHRLTQKDVDMANSSVELIERTRSEITPQIGDRLVYVTELSYECLPVCCHHFSLLRHYAPLSCVC